MRTRWLLLSVVAIFWLLPPPVLRAQNTNPEFGLASWPLASYSGGKVDAIDNLSGNLSVTIPLASFPQKGALKLSFALVYQTGPAEVDQEGQYEYPFTGYATGWSIAQPGANCTNDNVISQTYGDNIYYNFIFTATSAEATHQFLPVTTANADTAMTWRADDGSGLVAQWSATPGVAPVIITDPQGLVATLQNASGTGVRMPFDAPANCEGSAYYTPLTLVDAHGNTIIANVSGGSLTGWTDSMGRAIPAPAPDTPSAPDPYPCPVVNGLSASSSDIWNFPGPNNQAAPVKICWTQVPWAANYCVPTSPNQEYCNPGGSLPEIQSIVLANGTSWQMQYGSSTGVPVMSLLTLPTGGTIAYTWNNAGPVACNAYQCFGDRIHTRTASTADGTAPDQTLTYAYFSGINSSDYTTTVTDTAGDVTTHNFNSSPCGYLSLFEANSTLAGLGGQSQTVTTSYNCINSPASGFAAFVFPTLVTTALTTNGATVEKAVDTTDFDTTMFYSDNYGPGDNGNQFNGGSGFSGPIGLVTARTDYDWGSVNASGYGAALRTVKATYAYASDNALFNANLITLPLTVETDDGSGGLNAKSTFGYNNAGDRTSAEILTGAGASLASGASFDGTGAILTSTDAALHVTTFGYTPSAACTSGEGYAASGPASITDALNHVTTFCYDLNTGLKRSATDANGQTTGFSFDSLRRLIDASYPDGGETRFTYTDTPGALQVEIKRKFDSSGYWTDRFVTFDGLGRQTSEAARNANGSGNIYDRVDTCYNGMGEISFTSYPFQTASSSGPANCNGVGDNFNYVDAFGRRTLVTHSDGSTIATSYTDAASETTDEGNGSYSVSRVSQSDALGRIASVCEVTSQNDSAGNAPSGCGQNIAVTGFLTTYAHDALGDLTQVSEGAQTRQYYFDYLGRLTSASNPESGTTDYVYDGGDTACPAGWGSAGDLASRTDARGDRTCYQYDALHRQIEHALVVSGQPDPANTVTFEYDNQANLPASALAVGHLIYANTPGVQLGFTQFDPMGRPEELDTTVGDNSCYAKVSYDMVGFPTYERLPSGRHLYLTDDNLGRTAWIGDADFGGDGQANYPYVADRYYDAAGVPSDEDLGNGERQGWTADARERITQVDVYDPNNYNWSTQRLDETLTYNPDSTPATMTDQMGSAAQNFTYKYDPQNRLSSWSTAAGLTCAFWLDRYGNMTDASGNANCNLSPVSFGENTNRIVGDQYDSAGDLTGDGVGTVYTWNADQQMFNFQVTGLTPTYGYLYDALGRRTEKTVNGAVTAIYLYNPLGDMVDELDGSAFTDFIYAPAGVPITGFGSASEARIAAVAAGGVSAIDYYHADPLGTTRALTDASGNNPLACGQNASYTQGSFLDYTPYGNELSDCTQSITPFKFTGKYRDTESGLDDFGARYSRSRLGRFLTPDPLGGHLDNPQTLNKYAYAADNPVTFTDPTGLYVCSDSMPVHHRDGTVTGCTSKQDQEFATALARDAASANSGVATAAEAYGVINHDNGVAIKFGITMGGTASNTNPGVGLDPNSSNGLRAIAQVTFGDGLSGADLDTAVGHEGSHIEDFQREVAKINPQRTNEVQSLTVTVRGTEERAYAISNSILAAEGQIRSFCASGGCPLGAGVGPAQEAGSIQSILSLPPYNLRPGASGGLVIAPEPGATVPHP